MAADASATPVRRRAGIFTRSEALRGWTLLMPAVLFMFVGLAAALGIMVAYSLWTKTGLTVDTTPTLDNYTTIVAKYWPIMLRTLWMSGMTAVLTVLISYPIAYYVAFRVKRYQFVWLILLTIPFWTSYLLRIFAWRMILPDGLINTPWGVVLAMTHAWTAFAILPIYVSLQKIDRTLLEAAADLGDSPARSFWRITFPLSLPGVISSATLVFVPTLGDYVTPTLVGGGKPASLMISNIIQAQMKATDLPSAAATAFIAMAMVAIVLFFFIQALRLSVRSVR